MSDFEMYDKRDDPYFTSAAYYASRYDPRTDRQADDPYDWNGRRGPNYTVSTLNGLDARELLADTSIFKGRAPHPMFQRAHYNARVVDCYGENLPDGYYRQPPRDGYGMGFHVPTLTRSYGNGFEAQNAREMARNEDSDFGSLERSIDRHYGSGMGAVYPARGTYERYPSSSRFAGWQKHPGYD
ncbi:hypothetical protein LTS10_011643 [Elasticomyces elasticus]|nr:hypothetical protein LTS10_011643 [Elasticomyces elasticus]